MWLVRVLVMSCLQGSRRSGNRKRDGREIIIRGWLVGKGEQSSKRAVKRHHYYPARNSNRRLWLCSIRTQLCFASSQGWLVSWPLLLTLGYASDGTVYSRAAEQRNDHVAQRITNLFATMRRMEIRASAKLTRTITTTSNTTRPIRLFHPQHLKFVKDTLLLRI
jgi:hypothetical protein